MKKYYYLLAFCLAFSFANAQQNMSLLGHLAYSNDIASLWGWSDGNGHEYALVGAYGGLSIVDVTVPSNPVQLQFVTTNNSFWHEVKTWSHYAYVVNESGGGLLIVDLATLPNAVVQTNWTGGSLGLSTGHSLFIDEDGIAYINGSNVGVGGVLFLDLNANPMNPVYLGAYTGSYVHDCYVRNDTMWAAEIYHGWFKVINVLNKSAPVVLGSQSTPGNFTHNTALSDNGKILYTTDEVTNSYVTAYDVSALSNITETDRFQANPGTSSIAHNVHVKGNFLVTAYYRDGVIITDAHDPHNLVKVGSYDTSPLSGNGYNGCWEAYPYLPSGNIIAADIEEGLYVLSASYVSACLLQGLVTDYTGGAALNGVTVSIVSTTGTTVTTDLSGNYKTGYGTAGTYSVQFSKSGYYTKTITGVSLSSGLTTQLNTTLKKTSLPQCTVPSGLYTDNISANSAKLHWSDEYGTLYTVKVKKTGNSVAQTFTSTTNSLTVTNLVNCSGYKFKVKAKCPSGSSTAFSAFASFSTSGCNKSPENLTAPAAGMEEVNVYPNPFRNSFDIAFSLEKTGHVRIALYDLSGRLVATVADEEFDAGTHTRHFTMTDQAAGIYLCMLQKSEGTLIKKIVKQE